jgi:polyketide synthase PksL
MIFPGSCFLEMACVSGIIAGEEKVCTIKDVVWAEPLDFQQGSRLVQTTLKSLGKSTEYSITSLNEQNEKNIHSEGRLFFQKSSEHSSPGGEQLSINRLKEQCLHHHDGSHYYELFEKFAFDYAPAFQIVIGLVGKDALTKPYLPFAIDTIEIIRPLPYTCYVYVEPTQAEEKTQVDIKKFNITLLNKKGNIFIKIKNFLCAGT